MFRSWLVGSVAALVVTLSVASDADAQRRGRGGVGYSMGTQYYPTYSYDLGGYRGLNTYPSLGYSAYPGNIGQSDFGYGYNYPTYSNRRRMNNRGSYSYSYPIGNYSGSSYSYSPPTNYITGSMPVLESASSGGAAITMRPATTRSGYTPQGAQALLEVRVPESNADVFIDGRVTQQRGTERQFVSPPLEQGGTYEVRVRWRDASGLHDVMRQVSVNPGATARTDFGVSLVGDRTGEELAEPPQREPGPRPRNRDDD